jgi:hypothetical protein
MNFKSKDDRIDERDVASDFDSSKDLILMIPHSR